MCVTSSNRGFTLLEVLIAVVMMGILAAALYGSYFAVVRARDRAAEGMESRRELGKTLDMLRQEIASSVYRTDDKKRLRFVVEDRDNFGKPASTLELTTLVLLPSDQFVKGSGISVVRYQLVEKDKRYILTRSEQDCFNENTTAVVLPQMERISGFLVECYDGSKWLRSWNSALNQPPRPKMVRITVQYEEDGKPVEYSVLSTPQVTGS